MGTSKVNWLLAAGALLVTLLVLEGVLRVSGIARMNARFTCFDAVLGKVYCPSAEGTFTKGIYSHYLEINSAGMLDREYPVTKPDGSLRIALLGDSFAASEYLSLDERFESFLEKKLSDQLGRPVDILNFSMSGTETWVQLQTFHVKAIKYQPDLVLLAFYWGNDISDNIERLQANDPNPLVEEYEPSLKARIKETRKEINKALWNHSLLYQVVHDGSGHVERAIKRWHRPDYLAQIDHVTMEDDHGSYVRNKVALDQPVSDLDINDDDLFFWDSDGWKVTRRLILKLQDEVLAAGSRLVVLHFPSEGLVHTNITMPHLEFDMFLDEHEIPQVSLFDGYYALQPDELQRHFIIDDGHWTRYGHRYVAERTREMLFDALSAGQ